MGMLLLDFIASMSSITPLTMDADTIIVSSAMATKPGKYISARHALVVALLRLMEHNLNTAHPIYHWIGGGRR